MRVKFSTIIFAVSLALNGFFISVITLAEISKSHTALLPYPVPPNGYMAAATIAAVPVSSPMVFNPLDITLKPGQNASLQYTVILENKQNNILINALYDPDIVSVSHTGFGIEITALQEGETLMQMITKDGIIDVALIVVTE